MTAPGTPGTIPCGRQIRLEPLEHRHIDGLIAAEALEPELYRWSFVPHGRDAITRYVETALLWREVATAFSFAVVRAADDVVLGSTRLFEIERWSWPEDVLQRELRFADACEIGYTWLGSFAIRTAANSEAKLLTLRHAFEIWRMLRVCFHTDARNERSRAALERIGARFEGILRAHRLATDLTARDSARFSITAAEWPAVRQRLAAFLEQT